MPQPGIALPSLGRQAKFFAAGLLVLVLGGLVTLGGLAAWAMGVGPWVSVAGVALAIVGFVMLRGTESWLAGSIDRWADDAVEKLKREGVIDTRVIERLEAGEGTTIRPGDDATPEALATRWPMALTRASRSLIERIGPDELTARTLAAGLPTEVFEMELSLDLAAVAETGPGRWRVGSYEGRDLLLDGPRRGAVLVAGRRGEVFVNSHAFAFARSLAAYVELMSEPASVPNTAARLRRRLEAIDAPALRDRRAFWPEMLAELAEMEGDEDEHVA